VRGGGAPSVQPLPSTVTTAPVFAAPAPPHAEAPSQSATGDAGEWSVIADKPKRKTKGSTESHSDREGYARQRNFAQQQYEVLEGIEEEEEERAEREREERLARAQKAQPQVSTAKEVPHEGEGTKESSGGEPTTLKSSGTSSSGSEAPNSSGKPAARRRRELGVRHSKSHGASTAASNAEAAAALASNENLKVMILAPVAMLSLLFLVYMLFF
jgi:hypothetical protein